MAVLERARRLIDGKWKYVTADESGGGGSQPGAVRVLAFPFDFSMAADLAVGVPVWTPAVGDILLDAWIETDDADVWSTDTGSVLADIGIVDSGSFVSSGFFNRFVGTVDLSSATWSDGDAAAWLSYAQGAGTAPPVLGLAAVAVMSALSFNTFRSPLTVFKDVAPLSLVVSGDGTPSGGAADVTAGASTLYIAVCTPGTTP